MLRAVRGLSFPQIAAILNRADHSSAIHGLERAEELAGRNPDFAAKLEELLEAARQMTPAAIRGLERIHVPEAEEPTAAPYEDCDRSEKAHRAMMRRGSAALRDALQREAA